MLPKCIRARIRRAFDGALCVSSRLPAVVLTQCHLPFLVMCRKTSLAGYFGVTTGLTTPDCSGPCDAGYFCNSGSTSPTQTGCRPGQWSSQGSASCQLCPPGRFGNASTLTKANCTALCPAGSECAAGTSNPAVYVCPPGKYSLVGAAACSGCPPGQYGATAALTSAVCSGDCTPGHYCPANATAVVRGSVVVGLLRTFLYSVTVA